MTTTIEILTCDNCGSDQEHVVTVSRGGRRDVLTVSSTCRECGAWDEREEDDS